MKDNIILLIRYIEILNEWESKFISDINTKLVADSNFELSEKQGACVDKMYDSVCKCIETMRNKRNGKKKEDKHSEYRHQQLEY